MLLMVQQTNKFYIFFICIFFIQAKSDNDRYEWVEDEMYEEVFVDSQAYMEESYLLLDMAGQNFKDRSLLSVFSLSVNKLDASRNNLTSIAINSKSWTEKQEDLVSINFSNNNISNVTKWDLLNLKRTIPSLESINLKGNPLTINSLEEISCFRGETSNLNENKMKIKYDHQ